MGGLIFVGRKDGQARFWVTWPAGKKPLHNIIILFLFSLKIRAEPLLRLHIISFAINGLLVYRKGVSCWGSSFSHNAKTWENKDLFQRFLFSHMILLLQIHDLSFWIDAWCNRSHGREDCI